MLRLAHLHGAAGDLGVRVYELVGFVPAAAVVALVAPGLPVPAHGARPLDVAVRQEATLVRAVHLLALVLRDVAALFELLVEELGVLRVQRRRGAREVVEANAEAREGVLHVGVPVVHYLLGLLPLAL